MARKMILPTPEDIEFVYEQSELGLLDQDIYYGLGWNHTLYYENINRCSEFRDARKKGQHAYRQNLMENLRNRQRQDDSSATFIALSLNRDAQMRGNNPNYSDETRDILSNTDIPPQDKIIAIVADHASGRISTKALNNATDALTKLAQVMNRDELDELRRTVDRIEKRMTDG